LGLGLLGAFLLSHLGFVYPLQAYATDCEICYLEQPLDLGICLIAGIIRWQPDLANSEKLAVYAGQTRKKLYTGR